MIFQDIDWIDSNINKLNSDLRELALEWYRPFRFVPGILQKYLKAIRQRVRKVSVIVQVEPSPEFQTCLYTASRNSGCKVKRELSLIDSFTAKVNAKTLEKLLNDESIKKVWFDATVKTCLDIAAPAVKAPAVWAGKITGKGIGVAVLDTGIYPHPDLSGRITGFKDFIGNKAEAYDDHGHGTHVAGDIASNGSKSQSKYRGTAPEANVIGVKVLNQLGSGSLSTVIEGIQWCIDQKEALGIRVMNLSLGTPAKQSYSEDLLCRAVEKAWQSGIVVCAAAGNEGPEAGTISSPGIDPKIITVGSIDDKNSLNSGQYAIASYSSRGPTPDNLVKPDVVSTGTNIVSLRSPNSTIDKQNKNAKIGSDYTSLSGTSMATPICAGIVALMLEAKPGLTPDEVKKILKQNANPLPNVVDNFQGAGLVDAEKSVKNAGAVN